MVCKSYKVKVPGSLMLFGEHAVLNGKQAVVAAVNKHILVQLEPRLDRNIRIISSIAAECIVNIDHFKVIEPYLYVLAAVKEYLSQIPGGFDLKIETEFSSQIGFGSSAAVTVATLALLALWIEKKEKDLFGLHKIATKVVRQVQDGIGSGADVAASVFGGIVAYQMQPLTIKKFDIVLPIVAIYSGLKTPTIEVIKKVKTLEQQFPQIFVQIYEAMNDCIQEVVLCLKNKLDLDRLGILMDIHHGLQNSLNTSNAVLEFIVNELRGFRNPELKGKDYIYGAKISGSGLGDCVIGLGYLSSKQFPKDKSSKHHGIKQLEVAVSYDGITY